MYKIITAETGTVTKILHQYCFIEDFKGRKNSPLLWKKIYTFNAFFVFFHTSMYIYF